MEQGLTPPVATTRTRRTVVFGHEIVDDYYWLRERENPEVLALLEAENRYIEDSLRHTEPIQRQLFQELVAHIKETDQTAPGPDGAFAYYDRTTAGQQYKIHCRTPRAGGAEEILIDENALAVGQSYFRMGALKASPDQRLLAYSTDTNGSERFDLYVKDLATGAIIDGPIPNTVYDVEWAADGSALFYTVPDAAWRTHKLFCHTLGAPAADDVLIYHEPDEAYNLHLRKARSGAFLIMSLRSNRTTEEWLLPADQPGAAPQRLWPRRHGVEYITHHTGDSLYIQTNEGAQNFKVVRIPVAQLDAAPEVVIPHSEVVSIDSIELFASYLAVFEREGGTQQLRIVDLASGEQHRAAFPEPAYSVGADGPFFNHEHDTQLLRISYSSMVTPPTVFDYDMRQRSLTLVKRVEVPGYDADRYRCDRLYATAPDGVRVPISIVYAADHPLDQSRPLFLYAYGSYGDTIDPAFDFKRIPLLARGFACAIAHVRGGGEMGRGWYEGGRVLTKRNTFTDFIAVAEQLVAAGFTRPDRLVIKGRSAGGLLMGAVVTMRPDLFQAVIAGVPFVDVVNTSLDPSIPLVVAEYEEWGDPRIEEQFECLLAYSPYDNTAARSYPHILATAGLYDPRVQYWEPAKWVQKLRALKTDQNRVLLKTEMVGGHAGPSGRYDYLRDIAFEYAFFLDALGMIEVAP